MMFFIPIINGSNQSLWQTKVSPDLQGRVFATRRLIAQITMPLGMVIAGPLADQIFEPAMSSDGTLSQMFGWLVGTGPGAGMALIIVGMGVLGVTASLVGYAVPTIREVDTRLPDHDTPIEPQPVAEPEPMPV